MSQRHYISLFLLAAACVAVAAYFFYPTPAVDASEIVAKCAQEASKEKCYERDVPALYPERSIPEILQVVREIRDLDPSYQFCHVLAHKLGENAVAADPSQWLDLIPLNPSDGLCSNGFIHGLIVGRFRNDVLDEATLQKTIPDFKTACEPREGWNASRLDQAICYHGMGHLFMFITNADIPRALEVCDAIGRSPTGDFLRVCREGVFMQIYQPLEPDDFALVELLPEKPTAQNYRRLCAVYDNAQVEGACLREAWPLFREGVQSGTGVTKFCAGQPDAAEEEACYQTASAIVGRMSLGSAENAALACTQFPPKWQKLCFVTVAQAVVEEDRTRAVRAIALCKMAVPPTDAQCLIELAGRASFVFAPGSPEGERFCAALPEDVRERCRI